MNPRFISNLSCGWIWASRRGHEQIVHLSLKNLNLAYVRVSIRRRTSNAVRLLNLIIKHLLSNLLKPKFHVQPFTPTCMGFKKKARANRAPKAKKVKSDWLVIGRAITRGNIKKNIQNLTKELR